MSTLLRPLVATGVLLLHVLVAWTLLLPGTSVRLRLEPFFISLQPLRARVLKPTVPRVRRPVPTVRATVPDSRPLQPTVTPAAITPTQQQHALDLHIPERFLTAAIPAASAGWVFDARLAQRLDDARRQRRAHDRLAARRRARNGVSADEYQRWSGLGEKVKTDAGCFELREDPFNHRPRWWLEGCTDTRQSPWDQPPDDE